VRGAILWVDNDKGYILPFVEALRRNDYEVVVVDNAWEAERRLTSETVDLVIIDVMIPLKSGEGSQVYNPEQTKRGLKTGLLLFRRLREQGRAADGKVLVLSVRIDEKIRQEFLEAGLHPDHFVTKLEVRRVPDFLAKVAEMIIQRPDPSSNAAPLFEEDGKE